MNKKSDEQNELKKKVMAFLIDEWEHNVPLEKLKDPEHINRIIAWIETKKE